MEGLLLRISRQSRSAERGYATAAQTTTTRTIEAKLRMNCIVQSRPGQLTRLAFRRPDGRSACDETAACVHIINRSSTQPAVRRSSVGIGLHGDWRWHPFQCARCNPITRNARAGYMDPRWWPLDCICDWHRAIGGDIIRLIPHPSIVGCAAVTSHRGIVE